MGSENMKNVNASNQRLLEVNLPITPMELRDDLRGMFLPKDFQTIMLEAFEETLSILGETAKRAIYSQLEETFENVKQGVPFETEKFAVALEEIIGPGARLLEIDMMKHLYEKVGQEFKYSPGQKSLTFTEYLTAIHTFLSNSPSARKPKPDEYYKYKFC
jgi:hypothetical protein